MIDGETIAFLGLGWSVIFGIYFLRRTLGREDKVPFREALFLWLLVMLPFILLFLFMEQAFELLLSN